MMTARLIRRLARTLRASERGASVYAIRCPWCWSGVKPSRFDLAHMACRSCQGTLHRPARTRASVLGEGVRRCR